MSAMKMTNRVALFIAACFAVATSSLYAAAGEPCGVLDIYDVAMPRAVSSAEARNADEVVILRYVPGDTSVETEFRIALITQRDGTMRAERTEPQGLSIQSQMRKIDPESVLSCEEINKRVKLVTRSFSDQRVLRRQLRRLHELKLPIHLASEIYLDAPRYEIVIMAGMNEATFVLYGPTAQAPKPNLLITWFRQTAEALPK
jgi:hypothetical protein